jgi:uncharacterized protein YecE (DUF72 family)
MSDLRIGISGWRYEPWRKTFYPKDLAQKRELEFASRQFNSIEINGSFYSLQRVQSWQQWYRETPDGFVFSVKGGRFITHMKKLKDVEAPLANFLSQGVLALEEKLGPILWQFPPGFAFNHERFDDFFKLLPRDTKSAAKLARKHDARMKGRTWFDVKKNRSMRHAVEIRHESFRCEEFVELLRKHNIALVVADTAGKWPFMEDVTADFVYARLHGDEELYVSGYTPAALEQWAERVKKWRSKRLDVYVYFDNDAKVRSPFDAIGLSQWLGGFVPDSIPEEPPEGIGEEARQSWPVTRRRAEKRRAH